MNSMAVEDSKDAREKFFLKKLALYRTPAGMPVS